MNTLQGRGENGHGRPPSWHFQTQGSMHIIIESIDGSGHKTRRQMNGRMAITEHETILKILERCTKRFQPVIILTPEQETMDARINEMRTLRLAEGNEAGDLLQANPQTG